MVQQVLLHFFTTYKIYAISQEQIISFLISLKILKSSYLETAMGRSLEKKLFVL